MTHERLARLAGGCWAIAVIAGLAIGACDGAAARALADGGPACPFRALTGVPCPFCGMTHAVLALGRGDLRGALAANPAAPLVLVIVLAVAIAIASGRGAAILRGGRGRALVVILAIAWVANAWRALAG
jgi:hypothetical protein